MSPSGRPPHEVPPSDTDRAAVGTGGPAAAALPRMLLVEDDAAIRQFVGMALEDLPIQVQACATLAAAREALLRSPPPFMVLLDLMLPDGRGQELLADEAVRAAAGDAAWVVFSAGVPDAARNSLLDLGVASVLRKPVALDELLGCVERHRPRTPAAAHEPPAAPAAADDGDPPWVDGSAEAEAWATTRYFDAQPALFASMKALTLNRLPEDRATLEAALRDGHRALARRLAHNLRSVLRMIGCPVAARAAESLEATLAAGDDGDWRPDWDRLQAAWPPGEAAPAPAG